MKRPRISDAAVPPGRPTPSYGDRVRSALRDKHLTIRQLSSRANKSYEYCRKVVAGEVLPSPMFNDLISRYLRLDAEAMWIIAEQERAYKRFGALPGIGGLVTPPPDDRLLRLWPSLTPEEKRHVQQFVEALIGVREADALIDTHIKRRRGRK